MSSKRSSRPISHAWRVTYRSGPKFGAETGFCASRALAEDAVARLAKQMRPARHGANALFIAAEIVEAAPVGVAPRTLEAASG